MKYCLILVLFIAACQTLPQAPDQNSTTISAEEEQIAKDLIQGVFDDIWGGLDSTKISDYHTDDFIILEQGEIWNNDGIRAYIRQRLSTPDSSKRINRMEYISIDKYGPSIQIVYHNFADLIRADTIANKAQWLESALAVPTEKGWRLKMMHSTWALKQ